MVLYAGVLLSIFMDYVRPESYVPVISALKLNSLVPLLTLLLTVFHKGPFDNPAVANHSNSKWLMFFMFLLLFSVFTAEVTEYSYKIFKVVLGFVFWYYMISRLFYTLDRIKGLFMVMVLSHLLLIILNPKVITNPEVRTYISGNSFLGDGNDFSLSVCVVMPMCLYLILDARKFVVKSFWVVTLMVLILAVIGTQSRGATLALASVFLYLWWMGRQKIIGIMLIGSIVAVVLNYAPPVYFERMNSIANYEEEGSAMGRIVAWKTAIRMIKKYPLTGVGSGHFAVELGTEFRPPEFGNQNLPWLTAHSMYFLLIGELGVPGIAFLLSVLIGNYLRNTKMLKEARGSPDARIQKYARLFLMLNGSLIAFAVAGAFLSVAYYPHLYVLLGIFTASHFVFNKELDEKCVTAEKKLEWYENSPGRDIWNSDK